jgi:hypothetical protein
MNDRQRHALLSPISGLPGEADAHRYIGEAGDGALIVTILAVDR